MALKWPGLTVLLLGIASSLSVQAGECQFPDLTGMEPIPMQLGAQAAAGSGGEIAGGRWELVRLRYATSPFPITLTGEAIGAIEMDAAGPISGTAGLALEVTISEPEQEEINEAGSGPYSAVDNMLTFEDDCGEDLLLGEVEYDINTDGEAPLMTIWASDTIDTGLFPVTIFLQAEFELVEPEATVDPIFEDRFEE